MTATARLLWHSSPHGGESPGRAVGDTAWTELGSGREGLEEAVAELSSPDLERLLTVAIIEISELSQDVERDTRRIARRLEQSRQRSAAPTTATKPAEE